MNGLRKEVFSSHLVRHRIHGRDHVITKARALHYLAQGKMLGLQAVRASNRSRFSTYRNEERLTENIGQAS